MKEIIYAENITKIYGDKNKLKVLHNVNLTVNEGDFICIMGPSGSGKSTLLNILSTVDSPSTGKIKINDKDVYDMTEAHIARLRYENIGFVFQEFNLIDSLTIRENIGVPLVLANIEKSEIKKKTEDISKKLDIFETLDKFPAECSGGQRQRAASARALITAPKIIVADEPTGNLDTTNSHQLLKIFQKRNEDDGIAILMVTHDSMIASYAKKLVFLRDGKIDEVLERGNLTQREFFYKIIDITSKETQNMFDKMG
ncbi:putative ABC transport system ATP-binding protein [Clostridium acidisoli DSM 12555]|jgi:putative ABC transport system ATP-binding protein|uniref:Putative ABC transport system ATP-binding protein n=1 Tax=Clostridium acidisoli DSM 12555 TaxID=1121291 RepID=A0A1W1XSY4_9CLOT|nr:ABC transporter ATP-binding protein [Clostridium acidisoli]SMC26974.1 putative ABC transport system ATP-binding protein [Clostridium acidisoli DSM 12555]